MFNKTTDSILSVFTKTIKILEEHSANSYSKGVAVREQASKLMEEGNSHISEALKAREAAQKIKGIFSGSSS